MTTATYRTPHEIARLGFAALVKKLGPGDALRFVLQYERGEGNYTEERNQLFAGTTLADIEKAVRERRAKARKK
jgi:hypothetical protein